MRVLIAYIFESFDFFKDHKYICKLSQLIGKFENVAKHLDSISASLNKSDIQGTIQIDFKYQKYVFLNKYNPNSMIIKHFIF